MRSKNNQWLERFLSLTWYETLLRFVITFIAKTSELLLAAGLIVSTTNFLTDGGILNNNANASVVWGWVQALALDSGLGISFFYVLNCLKQRDWVKFALYTILTVLLALVAGAITNVDTFSHAIHTSMSDAMMRLGFDVKLLSTLRAIAVVGFVSMSRLKDVSFKDLYTPEEAEPKAASQQESAGASTGPSQVASPRFTVEEVAQLLHALSQQSGATIQTVPKGMVLLQPAPQRGAEDQSNDQTALRSQDEAAPVQVVLEPGRSDTHLPLQTGSAMVPMIPAPPAGLQQRSPGAPVPPVIPHQIPEGPSIPTETQRHLPTEPAQHALMEPAPSVQQHQPTRVREPRTETQHLVSMEPTLHAALPHKAERALESLAQVQDETQMEREERLERAFQSLITEGKKPSGRALAERAHVHRSTCITWLQARQQKTPHAEQISSEL